MTTAEQPYSDILAAFTRSLADRYRIERELGRGGMATVYLAEDLRHERQVAIKLLHPELGAWLGAQRFASEIRITARLQHPHILPLLDSGSVATTPGSSDELLYYVMPYVAGETLRARLTREHQLPLTEVLRVATEAASALAHAHAAGVIHRDIKPENILLGTPNAGSPSPVLVTDFGIARAMDATTDRLTSTGITVGTPAYMSPEQATAERDIDARTDVYSLGCVAYEMLAGEPPFTGPNPRAVLAKQLSDPVRPVGRLRDGVPAHIDEALAIALRRSAADRFPDMASFAAALQGSASSVAGRVGATSAGRAPTRRRALLVPAILVIAAIAAATWAKWPREPAVPSLPSVRIGRFATAAGDTASAYIAATLQQDVAAALADSRAARVFVTNSAPLASGYAVTATAARIADSVEVKLSVTAEPTGEFKGRRTIRQSLGRVHELPRQATNAILTLLGRSVPVAQATRPPTTDSLAYDLVLRGRYQTDRRTELGTQRAVGFFRAAVARDSNLAEGWAGLARALQQASLRRYRIPGIGPDSILSLLVAASERAIEADSTRSYVWIARGLSLRDIEPASRRAAILAYQRAIELDSNNADAWYYAAIAWDDSLEPARARAAWERAVRIDPTHRQALGFLGQHFNWMRQYDSARFWADSGRRIDPTFILARQQLAIAQLYLRDTARAAENFRAAVRIGAGPDEVNGWIGLVDIAVHQRDRRAADTLFARALALVDTLHPTVHDAAYMAWGYAALGDNARAVRILERFDPRADSHFQMHLHCDPGLDPLRSLPSFKVLIVRHIPVCV